MALALETRAILPVVRWVPLTLILLFPSLSAAQAPGAAPAEALAPVSPSLVQSSLPEYGPAQAEILSDLALSHLDAKETEGWVLLAWGLANVVGGGLIAGIGHEDDTWLFTGLTTMAWGVVNASLALLLLDLSGNAHRAAEAIREERGRALFERHLDLIDGQRGSATIFALNAGLDVAYVLAGVLLYALGAAESPEEPWMLAVGGTTVVQGAALLVFDLVNWFGSNARADALRRVIR